MLKAKVTLKHEQLEKLRRGESIIIRLRDTELEIKGEGLFDVFKDMPWPFGGKK